MNDTQMNSKEINTVPRKQSQSKPEISNVQITSETYLYS